MIFVKTVAGDDVAVEGSDFYNDSEGYLNCIEILDGKSSLGTTSTTTALFTPGSWIYAVVVSDQEAAAVLQRDKGLDLPSDGNLC